MKHFILLFFFSLVLGSYVTAQLATPVELTRLAVEPEVIDATDVDMDGDIDIVSHSLPSAEIVWFENFGQGNFDRPKVLVAIPRGDVNFKLVDLDGDGDEDLLIASDYSSLILYENDGQGNYGNQSILMEGVDILGGLYTADADFDGDLDIVEMDITNEEIGVIYNLGEGNFSSFTSLMSDPEYIDYIDDIKLADVNSNGSIDILIHREPGLSFMNITWSQGPGFFAENEFDALASATWPSAVLVSDLDGDNDQDFIVGYEAQSGLTVLENIGGGNFTNHFQWFTNLSSKHESLNDLDGDGDVDYIFSDGLTLNSNGYSLYWLENLGDFMFGPPEIISSQQYLPRVDDICVADLNGNGLNCIVTLTRTFSQPSGQKDEISWFDNFGEGSFGSENVLTTANSVPFDINFADVDQDGAIDIYGCQRDSPFHSIYYHRNLGFGNFSEKIVLIDSISDQVRKVQLSDMNSDGELDVFVYGLEGIGRFSNLGDNIFGPQVAVDEDIFSYATVFTDLDQDGDQDFVSYKYTPAQLIWFEFSQPDVITEVVIDNNPLNYEEIFVEDLDGDGDLDIIGDPFSDDEPVSWYENFGSNTFSERQDIQGLGSDVRSMEVYHQNDGRTGLLIEKPVPSSLTMADVFLYENNGAGNFSPKLVNGSAPKNIRFMQAVDVDESGNPNVLYFEKNFFNVSTPDYYLEQFTVSPSQEYVEVESIYSKVGRQVCFEAFDIDADGDEDLFIVSRDDNRILFIENSLYDSYRVTGSVYADFNQNGTKDSADVGLDGISVLSNPSTGYSLSSNDGNYSVFFNPTIEAEYVLTPQSLPGWSLTSDSAQFHVSIDSTFTWVDSLDFGFYPDSVYTNVEMDVTAGIFRCNNSTPIWVSLSNMGTSLPSGVIELELDPSITFLSAMTEPDSLVSNYVYWTMDSLFYNESQSIYLEVEMPPFTSIGDLLTIVTSFQEFDAFGEPSYFVSDSLQETLICAYDPNDKAVFPVGIDSAHYVAKDQELEYLIRFQNTGNDTAFTVIIEDQLPAELNLETFSVEASSHSMEAMVDYDGIASFTFENILLPDSNVDFLGSQGFVKFTIEPLDDLLPNTTISNMASIYFDLNPPIFTNTVFNTVECYIAPEPFIEFDFPVLRATVPEAVSYQWFLDGVIIEGAVADTLLPEFNGEYSVIVSDENDCSTFSSGYDFEVLSTTKDRKIEAHVYPNPFSEYATIKFGENLQGRYDLVICNTLGAQVQSVNDTNGSEILISRNDLGSGIFLAFLIEKATGEKLFIEKLVIQ